MFCLQMYRLLLHYYLIFHPFIFLIHTCFYYYFKLCLHTLCLLSFSLIYNVLLWLFTNHLNSHSFLKSSIVFIFWVLNHCINSSDSFLLILGVFYWLLHLFFTVNYCLLLWFCHKFSNVYHFHLSTHNLISHLHVSEINLSFLTIALYLFCLAHVLLHNLLKNYYY